MNSRSGAAWLGVLALIAAGVGPDARAAAIETDLILETSGQSMWGPGTALQLDLTRRLVSVQWGGSRANPLRVEAGGIASVETPAGSLPNPARGVWEVRNAACFTAFGQRVCPLGDPGSRPAATIHIPGIDLGDYGAEIEASTYGDIGLEFRAQADSGSVDVRLPVQVRLDAPDVADLKPGDAFQLDSEVILGTDAELRTVFPEVDLGLYLTYDVFAEATGKVCLKDCAGPVKLIPTIDVNGEAKIIGFNPSAGVSSAFQFESGSDDDEGQGDGEPRREKVNLTLAGEVEVKLPSIETQGGLSGDTLVSSGEDDFLTASLDIDELIRTAAGVPFPLGAEGIAILGGSLGYDVLDVSAGGILATTQDFAYTPEVMVSLDVGDGNPLIFRAGDSIQVTVPEDVAAFELKPTYFMASNAGNFNNSTGLRIDPFGAVSALNLDFGIDLPGFVNALGVADPNLSVGPLFEAGFRIDGPGVPVFDQSWALGGFNQVATAGLGFSFDLSGGDFAAELVTGSPVALAQRVANPGQTFALAFDYFFESGLGTLDVMIDDVLLTTLIAGTTTGFSRFEGSFDLADLLGVDALSSFLSLASVDLTFLFDGPTGSVLLLDEVVFDGLVNADFGSGDLRGWTARLPQGAGTIGTTARLVAQAPEPASLLLLGAGLLTMALGRRRPVSVLARVGR